MATYDFVGAVAPGRLGVAQGTIPEPGDNQLVIKVEYSTLSPFDLYGLDRQFYVNTYPHTFGINAAGTVFKVGAGISDLRAGDRVTAFPTPAGSKGYQPYTLQDRSYVAKIPDSIPFEKAVTYPDNFTTAFFTFFSQLGLPIPTEWPAKSNPNPTRPLMVYGAGATSGQYAVQLLKLAGYTNVVAVASQRHEAYLQSLGATHVVDYKGAFFAEDVVRAAGGKVDLVMDCISITHTFELIAQVVGASGKIAFLAPFKAGSGSLAGGDGVLTSEIPKETQDIFPEGVEFVAIKTFLYQQDERLANTLLPVLLPQLLQGGLLKPNRIRLLDHADPLTRTKDAFDLLRQNKVSGEKLVIKVGA